MLSARQHANLVADDVLAQVLDVEALTGLDQSSTRQIGKRLQRRLYPLLVQAESPHDEAQVIVVPAVATILAPFPDM